MDALGSLLTGKFADPDGPGVLKVATRAVVIAPSLAGQEADLLRAAGLTAKRWAVVSDENTRPVLGERIESALNGAGQVIPVVLELPHADAETVERVRAATADADALIAVGSGTINDLCKQAAFDSKKPYAVFGTAPSMNGYTSPSAASTVHGHKKSLPAAPPVGVFLDLGVLARAPKRLIRAGLGDSLCRCTAQADWLLAHLVRGDAYREAPFALLRDDEEPLFAAAGPLLEGDIDAMNRLARTLILSGFGMAISGGSYPASQGEHLISHYADMMGDPSWPAMFHGEQIGVTTLTMARIQESMLASGPPRLRPTTATRETVMKQFGDALGESCWSEFAKKQLDSAQAEALSARLSKEWPAIRDRIGAVTRPADKLLTVLRGAGAPTTPEELGWPRSFYRDAVLHCREIRNRWTFLDLAADGGQLRQAAEARAA